MEYQNPRRRELASRNTLNNIRIGVLTTGDCAYLLRVAPRTVTKMVDRGQLKCHRLLETGKVSSVGKKVSGDRRIRVTDLIDLMRRMGMSIPDELRGWIVSFQGVMRVATDGGAPTTMRALEWLMRGVQLPTEIVVGTQEGMAYAVDFVRAASDVYKASKVTFTILLPDEMTSESTQQVELPRHHTVRYVNQNYMNTRTDEVST